MFESKQLYIDKDNGLYKRYFRLLGIPFNEGWKPLPSVRQVALTQIAVARKISFPVPRAGNSPEFKDKDHRYFVFLMESKNRKVEIFRSEDLAKARAFATEVADYLIVPMGDHVKVH